MIMYSCSFKVGINPTFKKIKDKCTRHSWRHVVRKKHSLFTQPTITPKNKEVYEAYGNDFM